MTLNGHLNFRGFWRNTDEVRTSFSKWWKILSIHLIPSSPSSSMTLSYHSTDWHCKLYRICPRPTFPTMNCPHSIVTLNLVKQPIPTQLGLSSLRTSHHECRTLWDVLKEEMEKDVEKGERKEEEDKEKEKEKTLKEKEKDQEKEHRRRRKPSRNSISWKMF